MENLLKRALHGLSDLIPNPKVEEEAPPVAQETKGPEDPRDKYTEQLQKLGNFALEQGELEAFVDASVRELAWVAVTRNKSTVILGEILARLSWCVLEQSRYLDAQEELKQAKKDGQPVH
jgi:hypothetical protein